MQLVMRSKRFSIASLLLWIAIVAALAVIYRERSERSKLQHTVSRRNAEVGYISGAQRMCNEFIEELNLAMLLHPTSGTVHDLPLGHQLGGPLPCPT